MTLPNYRFLSLPSDSEGRDWVEKSQLLDQLLEAHGLELAEESVFILFEDTGYLVARAVIGPLKDITRPFRLFDRISTVAVETSLEFSHWSALTPVLDTPHGSPWMVRLERRIKGELRLKVSIVTKS